LDLLEKEVKEGNLKAALGLVRLAGLDRLPAPDGPVDPADIEAADAEEQFKRSGRELMARLMK
jgi:hypothetical protein